MSPGAVPKRRGTSHLPGRSASVRDWDAVTYDRISDPQVTMARAVLERLPLRGDETVLDAGCGSGRVTRLLLDRLPDGHVVAVDAAPSMVERARGALGDRATVLFSDLQELTVPAPVDAAFSNAVFQWVPDHDRLFERLYAALRPGGRLVAQCGGEGNIEELRAIGRMVAAEEPFAPYFAGWEDPWNYASPDATRARLERAGFEEVETWLEPWPVQPPEPLEYLGSVCLGHHVAALPEDLRRPFIEAIAQRSGDPLELRYVRLNIDARRPM
jgi:trans-aconitate 2-methyltransferase